MECSPTTLQEMSFGIYKKIGTYLTDWFALNPSHLEFLLRIYWQDPHCGRWRSGGAYLLALWNYDGTWTYSHSCALQFVSKCIHGCSLRLAGKFNVEVCVSQVRTSDGVLSHYTTGDVIWNLQEDWHLLDWLVCIESITFESDSFVNSFWLFEFTGRTLTAAGDDQEGPIYLHFEIMMEHELTLTPVHCNLFQNAFMDALWGSQESLMLKCV